MNLRRAKQIIDQQLELLASKNADYGSDNIIQTGSAGVAVRLMDKVFRVHNLTKDGKRPNHESVADSFRDIINYGIIGLMVEEGSWTGVWDPKMVYLAGPIDNVSGADASFWRFNMAGALEAAGIASYSPAKPYQAAGNAAEQVIRINKSAIAASDAVIAYLPDDTTMLGTIREVEYAISIGKPVIALLAPVLRPSHPEMPREESANKVIKSLAAYDLDVAWCVLDALALVLGDDYTATHKAADIVEGMLSGV